MSKKNLTREDYEDLSDEDRRKRHRDDKERRKDRRNKRTIDVNRLSE